MHKNSANIAKISNYVDCAGIMNQSSSSFLTAKVAVEQSIKSICGFECDKVEILLLKGSKHPPSTPFRSYQELAC